MLDLKMEAIKVRERLQALEEIKHDAEKGMSIIDGAVKLLERQERECSRTASCPVCVRQFESHETVLLCADTLKDKRIRAEAIRDAEAGRLYNFCMESISQLIKSNAFSPTMSAPRQAFYTRSGELAEWRQQKLDCMSSMSCFACGRQFSSMELPTFLSRMDYRAATMERELHMHPKFCPLERPSGPLPHKEARRDDSLSLVGKRPRWVDASEPASKSVCQSLSVNIPCEKACLSSCNAETQIPSSPQEDIESDPTTSSQSLHPQELMI